MIAGGRCNKKRGLALSVFSFRGFALRSVWVKNIANGVGLIEKVVNGLKRLFFSYLMA